MANRLISPSKKLGYTDIYLDFVAGKNPPRNLYPAESLESVADRLDQVPYDREKMAAILRRQNKACGSSPPTFENIDKLTDPKAVCVFSGQQAGFLTGPLLTIVKAAAIVKAAKKYAKQLRRPVIPIFWIAGDDHDFEEANHTWLLDRTGEPTKIAYETPPENDVPTSNVAFSDADELDRALATARECLGETDFTQDLYDLINRCYTPEDTFTSAFGKLMAALMKDTGLVLFCPGDDEVKQHAAGLFHKILERQEDMHDLLTRTNTAIVEYGYHLQVEKKDNASHMFFDVEGRKPVMRDNGLFTVGEKVFTKLQLEQNIECCSQRFSPDVLTRPILQSYLFPVLSQKGGPAEIAYLAQINPLFSLFDLPAPVHVARSTISLVEARFEKQMAESEIAFEDLTGDIEQVINRIFSETFPEHLDRHLEELKQDTEGKFRHLIDDALNYDLQMQKYAEQVYGKIDYTIKTFESKLFAAHKKTSKQTREKIYRLWHSLYPNRGLQERSVNITHFVARYGFGVVSFLMDHMESEETAHQLLYLSEMQT